VVLNGFSNATGSLELSRGIQAHEVAKGTAVYRAILVVLSNIPLRHSSDQPAAAFALAFSWLKFFLKKGPCGPTASLEVLQSTITLECYFAQEFLFSHRVSFVM
jgi:hypothetical protein